MERLRGGFGFGAGLLAVVAAFLALAVATSSGRPVEARVEGPRATAEHADTDTDAIRGVIEKYAKSIDGADTALASEIWSKSPDVSFIHPRGYDRGWEGVKKNVYEKLIGATFSERKFTPRDLVVHVYGYAAWAEFYFDFAAKLKDDGSPLKTEGRETQVLRKTDGRWEIVHVHFSGMPVPGKREGS
jgi:ketosteroid isomerase-like protein